MASRPIFVPNIDDMVVEEVKVNFRWHSGMSKTQKRKNVASLHEEAAKLGLKNILEVSTKSPNALGQSLSAMNLLLYINGVAVPLECAFQGSKVFEYGGPYVELFHRSPLEAKRDPRLSTSGKLIGFRFRGLTWELEPKSAFYDWLYLQALQQNRDLADQLLKYEGFTDIEYNPKKSYSTQARSCALYVCLRKMDCNIEQLIAN